MESLNSVKCLTEKGNVMSIISWFRDKEGPGTPAPKSGVARYIYLLKTYFWQFVWLTWVFLISCIPVVTIPAALTAVNRVLIKVVREGNVLFWAEYKTEFRRSFAKSLWASIVFVGLALISYYFLSLGLTNGQSFLGMVFFGTGMCMLALEATWGSYTFVLLAALDLPTIYILKNAWYLVFLGRKSSLAVMAASVSSITILLLGFPFSALLVAIGILVVTQYTICWFVNIPLEQYIIRPYEEKVKKEKLYSQ